MQNVGRTEERELRTFMCRSLTLQQTEAAYVHARFYAAPCASVSCRYNLQSDTWRSANNYKAIKQANPGAVGTIRKFLADFTLQTRHSAFLLKLIC